jgi:L-ascorbate metabolism protein UlaG (beta-lactamase superfamily)
MNKTLGIVIGVIAILVLGFYALNHYIYNEKQGDEHVMQIETSQNNAPAQGSGIKIKPISHASMVLEWDGEVIYTDPTGGAQAFVGQPSASIILVTDIHGDHLSTSTLASLAVGVTNKIVAPKAVADLLPENLKNKTTVMANGETIEMEGFKIEAVPMYNVPESATAPHTKGRGNGYVVERNGERVYVAGDTANTPEMRALKEIDLAFVPMNLPYTMGVEEAAQAVLAFKPKRVTPYHYRGQNGLSDINKFKELVNAGDSGIQVELLNFYP